jgi:cytochrome c oxidase subunit 1
MPRIRSERPAFEAHYPELADRLELEAHSGGGPIGPRNLVGDEVGQRQGAKDTDPS